MPPVKPPPAPQNSIHVKLARDIGEYGWAATAVAPTEDHPGEVFCYTVGLYRSYDHPELVIVRMNPDTAHAILGDLVSRIKAGERFEADRRYPELFNGRNRRYDAFFLDVEEGNRDKYLLGAKRWNAYEEFPALQVVFPDPANLMPWEEGFERRWQQVFLNEPEAVL